MEYFCCPSLDTGNVILDGTDLGPNKDGSGKLLIKQCNAGLHTITLLYPGCKRCSPLQVMIEIRDTNPILPLEVAFQCVG